ncbi:hypothetical protein E2562_010373 [Oryza meyeriana var. granulata]|uniref:Uncharacterized protein n=1 Tax=Oryza meyeriana var. granulata TaxID=110450 RepID=A0A6G1F6N1_9ORYZ|nr:hypothetical protein E2562_010373 [Oryza meyeriana var. granulata]
MAALCRGGGGAVQEWRRQIGLQGGGGFRKGAAPRRRGSGGAQGGAARGEQGGSAGPAEETPGRRWSTEAAEAQRRAQPAVWAVQTSMSE